MVQIPESGIYYNDYHPLLTFDNLKSIAPNFDQMPFTEWDGADTYNTGDNITYTVNNIKCYYTSLIDNNTGLQPDSNPNEWQEFNPFEDWLKQKTDHYLQLAFNQLSTIKRKDQQVKKILDRLYLFKGSGRLNNLINKNSRAVGFEITLQPNVGITSLIDDIGVQFDTAQTDFPIYLSHSSQLEPIATWLISNNKATSFQWYSVNVNNNRPPLQLDFVNDTIDSGGTFYLWYLEDDLQGNAIKKDHDFRKPCGGCNGWTQQQFRDFSQFASIIPFQVSNQDLNQTDNTYLWDINDTSYTGNTNWGLNIRFTIRCDWTRYVCSNKDLYTNLVGHQVAVGMLREMQYSTRDNALRDQAVAALLGGPEIAGLEDDLKEEYKAINFDMSDLNSACLPCINKPVFKTFSA